jgi:phosphopantetheine adenylyltransferase
LKFDHFHAEHERLLQVAFDIGNKVVVGLVNDTMLASKKFKENMQSEERKKE